MSWVFCFHCLYTCLSWLEGCGPEKFMCFFLTLDDSTLLKRQNLGATSASGGSMQPAPASRWEILIITMQTRGPWFAWKWSAATSCVLAGPNIYNICCNNMWPKNITDSTEITSTTSYFLLLPHSAKKKFRWTTSAARNVESFESSFRQGRFQLSLGCPRSGQTGSCERRLVERKGQR